MCRRNQASDAIWIIRKSAVIIDDKDRRENLKDPSRTKSTGKTWIVCRKDHLENLKELSQTCNRSRDFNHCNKACITLLVTTETATPKAVLNSLLNAWLKTTKLYYRWSERRHTYSPAAVANSGLHHNG